MSLKNKIRQKEFITIYNNLNSFNVVQILLYYLSYKYES